MKAFTNPPLDFSPFRHRARAAFWSCCIAASFLALSAAAQEQAERADRVSEFLIDVFMSIDPQRGSGKAVSVTDVLDDAVARMGELDEDRIAQAELLSTIGGTYKNLGLHENAKATLVRALELQTDRLKAVGLTNQYLGIKPGR